VIPPDARVLITREQLAERVRQLGADIARDYAGDTPVLVGVLKGAIVFLSDLVRATAIPLTLDVMAVSSYGGGTTSSGVVRITTDLSLSIEERHVILVEDIIDSGRTVDYLRRNLETRHPRSFRICALLDKVERREVTVAIDYRGFTIPNVFVVGYGMDQGGLYRNLPDIVALQAS
jgi:hypoxanthine phosphoribosyltransferase